MRYSLTILAIAAAAASLGAQSTLDLGSRARLRQISGGISPSTEAFAPTARAKAASVESAPSLCHVFVKLRPGAGTEALEACGAIIDKHIGSIVLATIPTDSIEAASEAEGVLRMQLSAPLVAKLDKARAASGIDKIHSGLDLPQAYTGKGVVTGLVDGGMDPNHINFKDAEGNTRIGYFAHIRLNESGTMPLVSEYTASQLPMFTTDDATSYHGTHTMGIMAGGYKGSVKAGKATGLAGMTTVATVDNPYYGVATEAEIAASCGTLQDYFIAQGVSNILDHAYREGKPSVINLSLGSNTGPHDGNGLMSQYLQGEADINGAIICIASGNEGDLRIALNKTFGEDDTELQTFLYPTYYTAEQGNIRYGALNIYSDSEEEFDVQAVIYNRKRGRIAERVPIKGNTNGESIYYVSEEGYMVNSTDVVSANFAKAFEGYVGLGSMIDEDTGRFYAIVDFMTRDNATSNADCNYILGIVISGKAGQRVDVYGDGITTEFSGYGIDGWSDGSTDGTISDLATTRSTITVGSYDTRDSWISLDGGAYGYDGLFEAGTISEFSSYGTLADGRSLPTVCAPGATIVSSTNTHFVTKAENGITPAYLQAEAKGADDKGYYWEQMAGTSMASPLVAGSIALWLEADPTLKPADVIDIIKTTATVDADVLGTGSPAQWGAGKFNAYEGLKEVLRRKGQDGIGGVSADSGLPRLLVSATGHRSFKVSLPGTEALAVRVADMSGRTVASAGSAGDELELDLGSTPQGVYILAAEGASPVRIIVN